MASMNIAFPDPMKDWAETQTCFGRYDNASEHVHDRIRHDQDRMSKILAIASVVSDKSLDDIWAAVKKQAQTR